MRSSIPVSLQQPARKRGRPRKNKAAVSGPSSTEIKGSAGNEEWAVQVLDTQVSKQNAFDEIGKVFASRLKALVVGQSASNESGRHALRIFLQLDRPVPREELCQQFRPLLTKWHQIHPSTRSNDKFPVWPSNSIQETLESIGQIDQSPITSGLSQELSQEMSFSPENTHTSDTAPLKDPERTPKARRAPLRNLSAERNVSSASIPQNAFPSSKKRKASEMSRKNSQDRLLPHSEAKTPNAGKEHTPKETYTPRGTKVLKVPLTPGKRCEKCNKLFKKTSACFVHSKYCTHEKNNLDLQNVLKVADVRASPGKALTSRGRKTPASPGKALTSWRKAPASPGRALASSRTVPSCPGTPGRSPDRRCSKCGRFFKKKSACDIHMKYCTADQEDTGKQDDDRAADTKDLSDDKGDDGFISTEDAEAKAQAKHFWTKLQKKIAYKTENLTTPEATKEATRHVAHPSAAKSDPPLEPILEEPTSAPTSETHNPNKVSCKFCGKEFHRFGLGSHERYCFRRELTGQPPNSSSQERSKTSTGGSASTSDSKPKKLPCKFCGVLIHRCGLLRHEQHCSLRDTSEQPTKSLNQESENGSGNTAGQLEGEYSFRCKLCDQVIPVSDSAAHLQLCYVRSGTENEGKRTLTSPTPPRSVWSDADTEEQPRSSTQSENQKLYHAGLLHNDRALKGTDCEFPVPIPESSETVPQTSKSSNASDITTVPNSVDSTPWKPTCPIGPLVGRPLEMWQKLEASYAEEKETQQQDLPPTKEKEPPRPFSKILPAFLQSKGVLMADSEDKNQPPAVEPQGSINKPPPENYHLEPQMNLYPPNLNKERELNLLPVSKKASAVNPQEADGPMSAVYNFRAQRSPWAGQEQLAPKLNKVLDQTESTKKSDKDACELELERVEKALPSLEFGSHPPRQVDMKSERWSQAQANHFESLREAGSRNALSACLDSLRKGSKMNSETEQLLEDLTDELGLEPEIMLPWGYKKSKEPATKPDCYVCGNCHGSQLVGCSSCSLIFHMQCHKPEIREFGEGTWNCSFCHFDAWKLKKANVFVSTMSSIKNVGNWKDGISYMMKARPLSTKPSKQKANVLSDSAFTYTPYWGVQMLKPGQFRVFFQDVNLDRIVELGCVEKKHGATSNRIYAATLHDKYALAVHLLFPKHWINFPDKYYCGSGKLSELVSRHDIFRSVEKGALLKPPNESEDTACIACSDEDTAPLCIFCGCQVCGLKVDRKRMTTCSECDSACHIYCLSTPLTLKQKKSYWRIRVCSNCDIRQAIQHGFENSQQDNTGKGIAKNRATQASRQSDQTEWYPHLKKLNSASHNSTGNGRPPKPPESAAEEVSKFPFLKTLKAQKHKSQPGGDGQVTEVHKGPNRRGSQALQDAGTAPPSEGPLLNEEMNGDALDVRMIKMPTSLAVDGPGLKAPPPTPSQDLRFLVSGSTKNCQLQECLEQRASEKLSQLKERDPRYILGPDGAPMKLKGLYFVRPGLYRMRYATLIDDRYKDPIKAGLAYDRVLFRHEGIGADFKKKLNFPGALDMELLHTEAQKGQTSTVTWTMLTKERAVIRIGLKKWIAVKKHKLVGYFDDPGKAGRAVGLSEEETGSKAAQTIGSPDCSDDVGKGFNVARKTQRCNHDEEGISSVERRLRVMLQEVEIPALENLDLGSGMDEYINEVDKINELKQSIETDPNDPEMQSDAETENSEKIIEALKTPMKNDMFLPFEEDELRHLMNAPKQSLKEAINSYRTIRKNEYLVSKKLAETLVMCDIDGTVCNCLLKEEYERMKDSGDLELPAGVECDSHCMNRLMLVTCTERNCSLWESGRCQNQFFSRKGMSKEVKVFQTKSRGYGLQLCEDVPEETFIMEFTGQIISDSECADRLWEARKKGEKCFYMIEIGGKDGMVLDAGKKGNVCRFMNHSCDPNCELQKWNQDGEMKLGVFSIKNLKAGDELTYDYNFSNFRDEAWECRCGFENCKGTIGGGDVERSKKEEDDSLEKKLRRKPTKKLDSLTLLYNAQIIEDDLVKGSFQNMRLFVGGANGITPVRVICSPGRPKKKRRLRGIEKARVNRIKEIHELIRTCNPGRYDIGSMKRLVRHITEDQAMEATHMDMNDSACKRCGIPGDLICCDGCPAAFHLTCINLYCLPSGEWYCSSCRRSRF